MRRLIPLGLTALLVPALALAGKTATEGTNTLKVKAKFFPAKASESKSRLRPIRVRYDYVAGTTDGSRIPDLRRVTVNLGGTMGHYRPFPKCDETDARNNGDRVCPRGSRVGRGTAIAELHLSDSATSRENLKLKLKVYNGKLDTDRNGARMKPRQGLLLYTEAEGAKLAFGFWSEKRGRQVSYYNPKRDAFPDMDVLYAIKELHLTFRRRSVRKGRKRIPFISAPTKCRRKWRVWATNEPYDGDPVTATHAVRCKKA